MLRNDRERVILFGAGEAARSEYAHLSTNPGINVLCFADNDVRKQGIDMLGLPVISPVHIPETPHDRIIIASMYADDIRDQLLNTLGVLPDKLSYSLAASEHLVSSACRSGKYGEAARLAQESAAVYGADVTRIMHAEIAMAQDEWPVAIEQLETLMRTHGHQSSLRVYVLLGCAYRRALKYEQAERVIVQGLKRYPEQVGLLSEHALLATETKQWPDAIRRWTAARERASGPAAAKMHRYACYVCRESSDYPGMAALALKLAGEYDKRFQPQKWESAWRDCVAMVDREEDDVLCEHARDLATDPCPPPLDWWMSLYYALFCRGRHRPAYCFKDIAVDVAADENRPYPVGLYERMAALLERNQFTKADQFIRAAIEQAQTNSLRVRLYHQLASMLLLQGNAQEAFDIWQDPRIQEIDRYSYSKAFEELIKDKTVAIVGGADVGLRSGAEIDSFDVVVRTAFLYNRPSSSSLRQYIGQKTTISYYSARLSQVKTDALSKVSRSNMLQGMVMRDSEEVVRHFNNLSPNILIRSSLVYRGMFRSMPLGVQRIVLDLVPYRPKTIKVFNCDFYIGSDSYHNGYSGYGKDDDTLMRGLAMHDPLRNIRHTNSLFTIQHVATDSRLGEILSMSEDDFIATMQLRWQPGNCCRQSAV